MMTTRFLIASAACFSFACSSSTTETKEGKTNEMNAKSTAQQQNSAIVAATSGNGTSAADSLYQAGSSSQGTVTASAFHGDLAPLSLDLLTAPTTPDEAGCVCTGKSCTFTSCKRGGSSAVALTGTLSADNGVFKCDLTWDTDGTGGGSIGAKTHIHVVADMTTTDTSIKGTLKTDGTVKITGIDLPDIPGVSSGAASGTEWTNESTFDTVLANGQTTGGTVAYNGTYKVGDTVYTGSGSVSFP